MNKALGRELLWVEATSGESDIKALHDCRCAMDGFVEGKIDWETFLDRLEHNGVYLDDYLDALDYDLQLCS